MYRKEQIHGYEEYQVDTNGVVYGKKGNPLKYSLNHNGYCIVNFYINHKRIGFSVHTLVAKQFIYNDDIINKNQVNHIDGNKENNCVNNLEWVTPIVNVRHSKTVLGFDNSGVNNINSKKVQAIDKITGEKILEFNSITEAANYFCKNGQNIIYVKNSIWRVLHGIRKSYKEYYWEFI